MATRACCIIGPTQIIGPTTFIGSDCPRSPFWSAACVPLALNDIACMTPPFVDEPALALVLPDDPDQSLVLDDPGVILTP